MNIIFSQFLIGILLFCIVFLHLAKKNIAAVLAYGLQSLIIVILLFNSFLLTGSFSLLVVATFTLAVKMIFAPIFFIRLIKKHALAFSVSTYLNTPLTLIIIFLLVYLAQSQKFMVLTYIVPAHHQLLSLALASLLLSLFLIINRKGALSQILGVLSMENSIVTFAIFAGLEQSPSLQMGILFNIFIWVIIAMVFISMIYRHFGTLDVTSMKHLTD